MKDYILKNLSVDMEIWPNFFIIGAPKAATSSLWAYLNEISGIYMSTVKEPNYFNWNGRPTDPKDLRQIRDKKKYLDLFKGVKNEKIIGEASPRYLEDPEVSKLIHEVSPNSRILASLRDPIERSYSNYLMNLRNGEENLSFHELVKKLKTDNITRTSRIKYFYLNYFENIKKYIDIFGKQNVKIIIFEEFSKEPQKHVESIVKFLDLKTENIRFNKKVINEFGTSRGKISTKILGNYKIHRYAEQYLSKSVRGFIKKKILIKNTTKPKIDEDDRLFLQKYYCDYVTEVEGFFGRKLPWKNFKN